MKKKNVCLKWGAMAACLCLVVCAFAIPRFLDYDNTPNLGAGGAGDLVPMIYVNNSLYQCAGKQPNLANEESKFVFLGEIKSRVDESQEPKENFQANDDIVGAKVYQYGSVIVVLIDDEYWLYETYGTEEPVRGGVPPDAVPSNDTDVDNIESTQPAQTNN